MIEIYDKYLCKNRGKNTHPKNVTLVMMSCL